MSQMSRVRTEPIVEEHRAPDLVDIVLCQVLEHVADVDVLFDRGPVDPHIAFLG